jgi:hypothetical protein
MLVALLLEGVLHLSELLLQVMALHHLCHKSIIKVCPSRTSTMLENQSRILDGVAARETGVLPSMCA